jgi:hypothetical protein
LAIQPDERDLRTMAELGPLDGWRCLHEATYLYEPGRNWLAGGLLTDPPEALVTRGEIEHVEISRLSGAAVVWTRLNGEQQRVYVLEPGRITVVRDRAAADSTPLCVIQLGDWQIVGEHALG